MRSAHPPGKATLYQQLIHASKGPPALHSLHCILPVESKPIDLRSICRQVIVELELSRPEHTIRFKAQGDGHGMWDPVRMDQLMSNLIGNAVDSSPPEEPVQVELRGRIRPSCSR